MRLTRPKHFRPQSLTLAGEFYLGSLNSAAKIVAIRKIIFFFLKGNIPFS
jgi:hypothetical protein